MKKRFASLFTVLAVLALASAAMGQGFENTNTEVDMMYQTAKSYLEAGDYQKAASELEKVMLADPGRLDALHDLGQAYSKLGEYDKAAAAYQRALKDKPGDERLLTNLGYYQMRAKDWPGAEHTYTKLHEADPTSYEANRWLGYINDKQKNYPEAIEYYRAAVTIKPTDTKSMGSLAKIYMKTGEKDKALAMYEKVIPTASPEEQAKLRSQLGKLYIDNKDFQKAAAIFGDLIAENPDSPANQYNLAISYIQIGHAGEAISHLETAIELKPDFCQAYTQLANACNETKQPGRALQAADDGIGQCSDSAAGLYYQKGRALEGMEAYDEAIVSFQMAVNDPTWGAAAKAQIQRQEDLMKRAQMMKNQ